MKATRLITITLLLTLAINATGTQFKTISSKDGISNSAILSLHQNSLGHIYIGTIDGLNIWNGHTTKVFTAADNGNYFFGNKTKYIIPADNENLFILTNYGLAILNMITNNVQFFQELEFASMFTITDDRNILSISDSNKLFFFNTTTRERLTLNFSLSDNEICYRMIMTDDGRLCIFTSSDIYIISFNKDSKNHIKKIQNLNIECRYASVPYNEVYYLITKDGWLCSFKDKDCSIEYLTRIETNLLQSDFISGIIPDSTGYLISFMQNGVFHVDHMDSELKGTGINCGVFTIIPDKNQPIIWVGTDGNGLIRWCPSATDIKNITYDNLPYSIKMPVRCIYLDRNNNLWFGTKGDGLYRLNDFSTNKSYDKSNTIKYCKANSKLTHNRIYAISESNHDIFWIGSEGYGINYYSYETDSIDVVAGSENICFTHTIIEQNDSTLWVATDEHGAYRCHFLMKGNKPVITKTELLEFSEPFNHKTSLFSAFLQNDSTIWFGSRGEGILEYNADTKKSKIIRLPSDIGFASNETFFLTGSKDILIATGNGLAAYNTETDVISTPDMPLKRATHSILTDSEKNIWVATNNGLTVLNDKYEYKASFDKSSGIEVLEYSDGACYLDNRRHTMFFGGVNGLTIIEDNITKLTDDIPYKPQINITNFIQNNQSSHISSIIQKGKLRIPYSKSIFAIEFSVVDNLYYSDYMFSYNIEGYDKHWTENNSNIIYLPSLNPGNYKLKIKYTNKSTLYESEECTLPIYIIPPIYKRWWALVLYVLLISLIIYQIVRQLHLKQSAMKAKIKRQYADEIFRIKSETTNTITEELSVQITFILGLCQQIRQQSMNNPYVANKVNLVEYNIAKINQTLHILNEYKAISESMSNSGEIALVQVSQIASEMIEMIKSTAKIQQVTLFYSIESNIIITINKEAFLTLFNSLIYKVISITSGNKEVTITISRSDKGGVIMNVIAAVEEDVYKDMVSTFDNGESYVFSETNFSDGNVQKFNIILCRKLVVEMKGSMTSEYDKKKGCLIINIELPQHNVGESNVKFIDSYIPENINTLNTIIENQLPKYVDDKKHLKQILLISSNKDISSFLCYLLSEKYNVREYPDNKSALENISNEIPASIIYDVSSSLSNFVEFMGKIKDSKNRSHIPIVAMTSCLQSMERNECIKLGADLCISFPFNMDYLHSALEEILNKRESIAEYYKSPISTFVAHEGKIIHKDDKVFMDRIFKIIEGNISNSELSARMIAEQLGISTRVMYRKLESITDQKLLHIIKDIRMSMATKLLSSSKLTIDEIMYRVGYDNRSTFYRNFKESYGITPKDYRSDIRQNVINALK